MSKLRARFVMKILLKILTAIFIALSYLVIIFGLFWVPGH